MKGFEDGGVLLVDKPPGVTSFGVVERVRRWSGIKKVGHTGSLDPFATGLLVLCLGKATRLSQYIVSWDKEYEGVISLGVETDTDDATGKVVARGDYSGLREEEIEKALEGFRGKIEQMPPVFSAKKLSGVPSYRRARRGEVLKLAPVEVEVHELELLEVDLPQVRFRAKCSKGTYMRSLARDLGRVLGCGGHLASLRRVAIGHLRVEEAIGLWELKERRAMGLGHLLWPIEKVLGIWPTCRLSSPWSRLIRHGQAVPVEALDGAQKDLAAKADRVLIADEAGRLLAIGSVRGDGPSRRLHPEQVFPWEMAEDRSVGSG